MALSRVIRTGNGTTTQFVVDFALGYLNQADVTARVGDEVDGAGNPVYRTITFLSDTLLQISGPPAGNGVRVVFERTVEKEDTLVHFSNGDVMDEENLDLSFKQILMVVHEVLDGRFGQFDSDLDMGGFSINNLGDPVTAGDAANKRYVDGRLSSNEVLVAQAVAARDAAQSFASASSGSAASSATSASNAAAAATASEASRVQAANSATASANSASAAAASAASTSGSVADAQAARAGAEAARDTALTYRDQAAGHVTSAQSAATASASSATASETSRQASGTSATASANSASASQTSRLASEAARDTALTYRDQASSSATASAGSASTAATHRDNAYKWSSEAEDIQVDDGVRTGYSAYHWSKKAELASGGGVTSWAGLSGAIDMASVMDVVRQFRASTAMMSSLNIPHGVAPSSPVNGDMWTTTSGLLVRVNGTVSTTWGSHNLSAVAQAEAEAGTSTQSRVWSSQRVRQNVVAFSKTVELSAGGLATGGGDMSASRTITVPKSTSEQAIAGTDDTTAMTPARTKEAIAAAGGAGSLFQSSRSVTLADATVRQNTGNSPIYVYLSGSTQTQILGILVALRVGTSTTIADNPRADVWWSSNAGAGTVFMVSAVVPAGHYYSIERNITANNTISIIEKY